MKINYKESNLKEVFIIEPNIFEDYRGTYLESYNEKIYKQIKDIHFVQDDFSCSSKHVLRGIHGDDKTWKLISCIYGKIYLIVVNCNKNSRSFGKWESFIISQHNHKQVLVPPMFGNGHLVLTNEAIFHYKQSTYYDPVSQFTYKWNDPRFNIWWPISSPIISKRDH